MRGIEIPDILNLHLRTPNLVILRLDDWRNFGSTPPDEIVAGLSALTKLEELDLQVQFGRSHPNRRSPLLTLTVLPSLTLLRVRGDTEAMGYFMARIDTPQLDKLYVHFSFTRFGRAIVFDTPHTLRFISRIPKLQALDEACIFGDDSFSICIDILS